MDRSIIHIDMDAFYASIEQRDNPDLKGKPVIIGGRSDRGVVSAASYEARKYGIYSSMPGRVARRLCPQGIFLPGNMNKYRRVSQEIHKIFKKYSSIIEPISIDEAFLDVSGKNPIEIAKSIKSSIKKKQDLTASIGISYNKFLAKLASDMDKPDGLTVIKKEDVLEILKPLSVRKIWGVGPRMENELNKLGLYYVEDIQNYDPEILEFKFGKKGKEIYDFSFGIDNRPVEDNVSNQSIGEEETFLEDTMDKNVLVEYLKEYSINLSNKLTIKGYLGRTITVKIKYNDFTVETRSITLNIPTSEEGEIFKTAKFLLMERFRISKPVRLIGLSVSNIIYPDDPFQLSMDLKL